jgi:hypothetical protein
MQVMTMERHSGQECRWLLTALKVIRFEDGEEFEDAKQISTKKLTIGVYFTPNKWVNIQEGAAIMTSPLTVLFEIAHEEIERALTGHVNVLWG